MSLSFYVNVLKRYSRIVYVFGYKKLLHHQTGRDFRPWTCKNQGYTWTPSPLAHQKERITRVTCSNRTSDSCENMTGIQQRQVGDIQS